MVSASEETLLEFPCDFPIKVMGDNNAGFAQLVVEMVCRQLPAFDPATVEMRVSKENRYLALTLTVRVESKPQLDALYQMLTGCPGVRMVL